MYPQPGLPPLPKAQQQGRRGGGAEGGAPAAPAVVGDLAPTSSGALDLTVRGSSRPLAALASGGLAAAVEAEGQEQVNILNLPLPEADAQVRCCGDRCGAAGMGAQGAWWQGPAPPPALSGQLQHARRRS